ncbi:hypothetical protein [Devosia alba]|uniref:hypothetical protein n=1 Tax=Devosia alba TaxID=3152360 RepID=UPI00326593AE
MAAIAIQKQAGSANSTRKTELAIAKRIPNRPSAAVKPPKTPKVLGRNPKRGLKLRPAKTVGPLPEEKAPPFQWWELPEGASVREAPPNSISESSQAILGSLLTPGGGEEVRDDLQELFAVIGLDFGTSCTKVVVRFPYEAGELTVAIPAPEHCVSNNQPHLWQTVLWLRPDGQFIAWPEQGALLLHALKQGVMTSGADGNVTPGKYRGLSVSKADAATAYLAYVIRYTRGWLRTHRPNLFRGRHTRWLLNLGLPAEKADNGQLTATYRQIAAAALLCANYSDRPDIEIVKLFLTDDAVVTAGMSEDRALELGIGVFP